MRKLWLLFALALVLGVYHAIPFQTSNVASLLPVQTLVIHAAEGQCQVACGGDLTGTGATLAEALEDLQVDAAGHVFLATAQQIVVSGTGDIWQQLAEMRQLRPAAQLYQAATPPDAVEATAFLLQHPSPVTLLELRAAQEYGDSVCVPRLEETQGRYTIADGTTV